MRTAAALIGLAFIVVGAPAFAADDPAPKSQDPADGNYIKPVILDSQDGDGAALGLEYSFRGTVQLASFKSNDAGRGSLDPSPSLGGINFDYKGQGTLASSAKRNPKNFLDLQL